MGFSFKDIKQGGQPKSFEAGNRTLKLNSIVLDQPEFLKKDNAYYIKMEMETRPIGDGFVGFQIDKDDESKGFYEGQIATVRSSYFSYQDKLLPNGKKISRNSEILNFVFRLCQAFNCVDWCSKTEEKHPEWFAKEQIEKIVEAFNKEKPFDRKFADFCIGGREYLNKNNYTAQDLFIVKPDKGMFAFGSEGSDKVTKYDEKKHLIKLKENEKPAAINVNDDPLGKGSEDEFPKFDLDD